MYLKINAKDTFKEQYFLSFFLGGWWGRGLRNNNIFLINDAVINTRGLVSPKLTLKGYLCKFLHLM